MKIIKKIPIFLFLGFIFLFSCQEDNLKTKENELERQLIDEARNYFDNTISDAVIKGTFVKDKGWSPGEVVPEWKEAYVKKSGDYEYVFVPIYTQKEYVVRYTRFKKNGNEYYSRCRVSQILCVRRSSEGVLSAAYMTLVPTLDYYNKNRNKVATQYIKHTNFHSNFTGRVIYNDIVSFRFMAVDKVEKGKFDWGTSIKGTPDKETFNKECQEMFENITIFGGITTLTRGNVDGGELEEVVFIYCVRCKRMVEEDYHIHDDWWKDYEDDEEEEDDDDEELWGNNGDGNNSGGSSGGGSGQNPPPSGGNNGGNGNGNNNENNNNSRLNPKINIPKRLKKQPEGTKTCVAHALYYSLVLMGEKEKPKAVRKDIENKTNKNIKKSGMRLSDFNTYLNENFKTNSFYTYEQSVDNGDFQIINTNAISYKTEIDPNGNEIEIEVKTPHAVLLVGYNPDGTGNTDSYIVLDPLTGQTKTIKEEDIRKNPPHAHHSNPFSTRK